MIEFKYEDARQFRDIMKVVAEFQDEPIFTVDREGVSLDTMDPTRVSLIVLKMPKHAFYEYQANKQAKKICFNVEEMLKIVFKSVHKDEAVKVKNGGDSLTISLEGYQGLSRQWNISLLEGIEEKNPTPKMKFKAKAVIMLSALTTILEDAKNVSENVIISANTKEIQFKAKGDFTEYANTLKRGNESLIKIEGYERNHAKAQYSLGYLLPFVKLVKPLVDYITLEYATEMPIKVSAPLDPIELAFWLAPRIMEEQPKRR